LFLWGWALLRDQPREPRAAQLVLRLSDLAMGFATPIEPWQAVRERASAGLEGMVSRPRAASASVPAKADSARGCFHCALLCELDGDNEGALAWLTRAKALEEDNYWSRIYLGYYHSTSGQYARALEDYSAAVALRPNSPWARHDRALVYRAVGDWQLA